MNIEKYKELNYLAKGCDILYIGSKDDTDIKVFNLLNKVFDNLYEVDDFDFAFEKLKKLNSTYVILDFSVQEQKAFEVFFDIQNYKKDIKIIPIFGENFQENLDLLNTLSFNINNFLVKPVDVDELIKSLLIILEDTLSCKKIDTEVFDILKKVRSSNVKIEFLNHYKGIPIKSFGNLLEFNNYTLRVKLQKLQVIASIFEKTIMINLHDIHMVASILEIDKVNGVLTLVKAEKTHYNKREMEQKRLDVSKDFRVSMYYKNKNIDVQALDVSFGSISLYQKDSERSFKKDEVVDLTIGFEVKSVNGISESKFVKIFAKGKIVRTELLSAGVRIIATIEVRKSDESTFLKYLQQREVSILAELNHC